MYVFSSILSISHSNNIELNRLQTDLNCIVILKFGGKHDSIRKQVKLGLKAIDRKLHYVLSPTGHNNNRLLMNQLITLIFKEQLVFILDICLT